MIAKTTKLSFLIYLLCISITFANKRDIGDTTIVNNYNKWLKSIQLDKLLRADAIKRVKVWKSPLDSARHVNGQVLKILILKPSADYNDLQDLANNWNYVQNGLQEKKGIDIYQLLLNKLGDFTNSPLKLVKVEAQSNKPEIFSFTIYYNAKLMIEPHINLVMGGDITSDYDFNSPPLNSILSNTYNLRNPINDLRVYYKSWEIFFRACKHLDKKPVTIVPVTAESGSISLSVSNVFGQVTGENYYEKIFFTIDIIHPSSGTTQVRYFADVRYAAGLMDPPTAETEYGVATEESEFSSAIRKFKRNLEIKFSQIFHANL